MSLMADAKRKYYEARTHDAQVAVQFMLCTFKVDAAIIASNMLWREGDESEDKTEVQGLSMDLYTNPDAAVETEVCLCELGGGWEKKPSNVQVRNTICWQVIIHIAAAGELNINSALQHICPAINADETRRSKLIHGIHKNLRHLVKLGECLMAFSIPSATMMAQSKQRKKDAAKRREAANMRNDGGDQGELANEDDFHLGSPSIKAATSSSSSTWVHFLYPQVPPGSSDPTETDTGGAQPSGSEWTDLAAQLHLGGSAPKEPADLEHQELANATEHLLRVPSHLRADQPPDLEHQELANATRLLSAAQLHLANATQLHLGGSASLGGALKRLKSSPTPPSCCGYLRFYEKTLRWGYLRF
jgi:hypothetical protein